MRSMAVMAVQGKEFGAAAVDGLNSQNSLELAAQVAKEVKAKCEGVNKVYCLTSGLGLCGDQVIEGIESVFGPDVPVFEATGRRCFIIERCQGLAETPPVKDWQGLTVLGQK